MKVFLFGTMDQSVLPEGEAHWRTPFMNIQGIEAFNPFVTKWTSEDAVREAEALETADAIVVNITWHTTSIGSLAELGWLYHQCVERNIPMFLRVEKLTPDKMTSESHAESQRARKLAIAHADVANKTNPRLYVCGSEEMLLDCVKWLAKGLL